MRVANEIHQNYRWIGAGWVFLCGMVRGALYSVLISAMAMGAISLPIARAQALIDSTHPFIRLDSSIHSTWDIPNGADFSFDHLLSIYEWHGLFNYTTRGIPALETNITGSIDTIQIDGKSHFLEDDFIRSNSLTSYIYSDGPIAGSTILRPLIAFDANDYTTSGLPGFSAASLVPSELDGFGVAGLRYLPPATGLDFSAAAGLAEQAQAGLNTAVGPIVRGAFNMPMDSAGENSLLSAGVLVDERFFHENDQRYSNDHASLAVASGVGGPQVLDSNHAYLDLGLQRRDFFYNNDSSAAPVKQERTEYSFSLRDSLNYPIAGKALNATVNAAIEPGSVTRQSDIPSSELTFERIFGCFKLVGSERDHHAPHVDRRKARSVCIRASGRLRRV